MKDGGMKCIRVALREFQIDRRVRRLEPASVDISIQKGTIHPGGKNSVSCVHLSLI